MRRASASASAIGPGLGESRTQTLTLASYLCRQARRYVDSMRPSRLASGYLSGPGSPGSAPYPRRRGPDGGGAAAADYCSRRWLRRPSLLCTFKEYRPGLRRHGQPDYPRGYFGRHPGTSCTLPDSCPETIAMEVLPAGFQIRPKEDMVARSRAAWEWLRSKTAPHGHETSGGVHPGATGSADSLHRNPGCLAAADFNHRKEKVGAFGRLYLTLAFESSENLLHRISA
jgi:hypothetical protein